MQKLTQQQLDQLTNEMHEYMTETGRKRFPPAKADELRQMGAKRCGRCTEVKHREDYYKSASNRDGINGHCKVCSSAGDADYRKRNPDKVLESTRAYREENRDLLSEKQRAYHAATREQRIETQRKYYQRNREQYREYRRTKRATDELYRLRDQLTKGHYRAVEAGNHADWVTPEELLQHWEQQGINPLSCYLTSEELTPQSRSIDHVVAISNGGEHVLENLMPCTLEANNKKFNLTPDEALARLNQ